MTVVIPITDIATPACKAAAAFLADAAALNEAAGAGALVPIQRNFRHLAGAQHNRFGVRSSFWNRMLSGTRVTSNADAATISMPREVALRFFGGDVSGKKAKCLTIPLRAEAYGKSVRQFSGVKFARIGGKLFAFTTDLNAGTGETGPSRNASTTSRSFSKYRRTYGGRRRITLLYLLVSSATIAPDKSVLPDDDELKAAARGGVVQLWKLRLRRAAR